LDKVQLGNNSVTMLGSIPIQVLYISGDDRKPYDALRTQIPYKYEMEINGIRPEDTLDVQVALEQMQVTILDGEELDVKAVPSFTVTVFQQDKKKLVSDVATAPLDTKKLSNLPGMAIYTVKPGDSLWSIGKKYYISVDRLRKMNELSSDDLQIGQKLLIVKEGI
jgi:LysM repeat protein